MQRIAFCGAVLTAIATLAAGSAAGAPAHHTYRLALAAGGAAKRDVNPARVTLATAWAPDATRDAGFRGSLLWELNATRWDPHGSDARRATYSIGMRASLRHALGESGRTFVEAGIGPMWIESSRLREEFDLGGELHFNSHIGIGRALGTARAHELAASVHHVSNADLEPVNPGIDFFLIEYSFLF